MVLPCNGEVRGHDCLHPLLSRYSNTNVSCLNHANIISTVTCNMGYVSASNIYYPNTPMARVCILNTSFTILTR